MTDNTSTSTSTSTQTSSHPLGMLDGVKVLDLSRLLPGPACTWFLSEMGAEVICVEPLKGTPTRSLPPLTPRPSREGRPRSEGGYFTALHGGKRSIALDLRQPESVQIILELVPYIDLFVEGFKPGTLESMGLSPERLHQAAPHLVIARLSGYGQTGPWAQRPGHDINYLSLAGAFAGGVTDSRGHALYTLQICDLSGALTAAMGLCAALFEREKLQARGEEYIGRTLDISLCESVLAFSAAPFFGLHNASPSREPQARGELLNGGLPFYQTYECADGRWLSLGALEPKFLTLVQEHLGSNPKKWSALFKTASLSEWVERLSHVCSAPVLTYAELVTHPQHMARGVIEQDREGVSWIRAPFSSVPLRPPPQIGEHSAEVLVPLIGIERFQELIQAKVIAQSS